MKMTSLACVPVLLFVVSQQPANSPVSGSSIVILGAGSPSITAERSGTCIAVIVNGTAYLFDAGPGVERRVRGTSGARFKKTASADDEAAVLRAWGTSLPS